MNFHIRKPVWKLISEVFVTNILENGFYKILLSSKVVILPVKHYCKFAEANKRLFWIRLFAALFQRQYLWQTFLFILYSSSGCNSDIQYMSENTSENYDSIFFFNVPYCSCYNETFWNNFVLLKNEVNCEWHWILKICYCFITNTLWCAK